MKKAVIATGGKQYLVSEGDEIAVELVKADKKEITFVPLLVINDKKISVGKPEVTGAKVKATIVAEDEKQNKVTSIRYKAKKRIRTIKGHRQRLSVIKINSIV